MRVMMEINSNTLNKILFGPRTGEDVESALSFFFGDTLMMHQIDPGAEAVIPLIMDKIVSTANLELTPSWDFAPTTPEERQFLTNSMCVHLAQDLKVSYEAQVVNLQSN